MDCTFTNPPLYDLGWLRFDTVRMRRRSCEVLYNETTNISSVMTDARCTLYSACTFQWLWSVCVCVNIDKSLCHQSWQHMKPHSWFLLFQRTGNIFVSSRIHFKNSLQSAVQTRQHTARTYIYHMRAFPLASSLTNYSSTSKVQKLIYIQYTQAFSLGRCLSHLLHPSFKDSIDCGVNNQMQIDLTAS